MDLLQSLHKKEMENILIDAASRTTTPAEKHYSSAKLESACVIWIVKKWKHYLYAAPNTEIITDSYGLQYIQSKENQSALVYRWLCEMEGFKYTVKYGKGINNIADYLSRNSAEIAAVTTRSRGSTKRVDYQQLSKGIRKEKDATPSAPSEPQRKRLNIIRPISAPGKAQRKKLTIIRPNSRLQQLQEIDPETVDFIAKQKADSNIQRMLAIAAGQDIYQPSMEEKEDAEKVYIRKGVVVKDVKQGMDIYKTRIVVPLSMQRKVIEDIHEKSHGGVHSTLAAAQEYYWFRGMKNTVRDVVRHCESCIARKGRPLTKEVLAPDERPLVLGGRWHIDGLFLPTSKGYDHLMVAIDAATKYVILRPCKGETSEAASGILLDIVRRFGRPQEVTTDRGRAFLSDSFMKVCQGLHIIYKPIAPKQPQADGMVERVNKTILDIASTLCKGNGEKWADLVGEIEYGINTRPSSTTKFTPYELVYGRIPPGPTYTDVLTDTEERGADEQVRLIRDRIRITQQLAHENQMMAANKQQSFHNAHAQAHRFKTGDTVWHYNRSSVERGVTSKLAYRWKGPYSVKQVIGPVTYRLEDKEGKLLPGTMHARDLHRPDEPQKRTTKTFPKRRNQPVARRRGRQV